MPGQVNYKGCAIIWSEQFHAFYWEDQNFGAESEDIFATIEAAKADIDHLGAGSMSPDQIDDELANRWLTEQP